MVRVSGRVVSLVLEGHHVDSPEYRTRLGTIYFPNAGIHFLENKKYTFEELAITVMYLKTPFKKDNISTLGGRYRVRVSFRMDATKPALL